MVELSINGRHWASYPSAALAATAVHLGRTHHKELDGLAGAERPAKLQDWNQISI